MEETITYSPELQRPIDLWHRAADLNDPKAQFDLQKMCRVEDPAARS